MSCYKIQILDKDLLSELSRFVDGDVLYLDVFNESDLESVKESNELNDVNQFKIDGVLNINVPFTPLNHNLFERFFDPRNEQVEVDPIRVVVWDAHSPLPQKYLYPVKKDDGTRTYELSIIFEKEHWSYAASNTPLNKIEYESFYYSWENIKGSWHHIRYQAPNSPGYFFPPVFYGKAEVNGVAILDQRPWFNEIELLKRGFCKIGYKIESPLFDLDEVQLSNVYVLRSGYGGQEYISKYSFSANSLDISSDLDNLPGDEWEWVPTHKRYIAFVSTDDGSGMLDSIGHYVGNKNIVDRLTITGTIELKNKYTEAILGFEINGETWGEPIRRARKETDNGIWEVNLTSEIYYPRQVGVPISVYLRAEDDIVSVRLTLSNDPQEFIYMRGDDIDVSSELSAEISLLDVLKGFTHSYGGFVITNEETRTITVLPPRKRKIRDVEIEGYYLDEVDEIETVEVDSMINTSVDIDVERHQYFGYKKSTDGKIKSLEQYKDEQPFTAYIDLGEVYKNGKKEDRNPLYEPTVVRKTDHYNKFGIWPHVNTSPLPTNSPWLPWLANDGKGERVNYSPSARRLIFQVASQRLTNELDLNKVNKFVQYRDEAPFDPFNAYEILTHYPIGYINLDEVQGLTVGEWSVAEYPAFINGLRIDYVFLFDNFVKYVLQYRYTSNYVFTVLTDPEFYYSVNFRKRLRFNYNGSTYMNYPRKIDRSSCGNTSDIYLASSNLSNAICEAVDGNDTDGDSGGGISCNNQPIIELSQDGDCTIFTLTGEHSSVIDNVTFEYQYKDEYGLWHDDWITLVNTSALTAELCNPTGYYRVRALVEYEDNCPAIEKIRYVDPCGNDPKIFWNAYTNNDYELCFSFSVGGDINSEIDTQTFTYSVNDGSPISIDEGEDVCLTGLTGELQVCIQGTISYVGDCEDSTINECEVFPPDSPDCTQTDIQAVCVNLGEGCYEIDTVGNLSTQAAAIIYQYKCGIDGQTYTWSGDKICCEVGTLYIRMVVIFCNDVCPVYCSEWTACDSPCNATVGVSYNCCNITATTSNCTNPNYVWEVADLGLENWTNIPDEFSASFNIGDFSQSENKKYRVVVTCDDCDPITSSETVINHSVSISDDGCDLTATLNGINCQVNYNWEYSGDGGETWTIEESGEALTSITANKDGLYRVVVTYGGCFRISNAILMQCDVCDDIVATIVSDDCCTLSVDSVTNTLNPQYEWQILQGNSWLSMTGETGSTFSITQNGTYRVQVLSENCEEYIYSNVITINYGVRIGDVNCTLSAETYGDCNNITYQWQIYDESLNQWTNIVNATNATYEAEQNGIFRVVATFGVSECIVIQSDPITTECDECDPNIIIGFNDCTLDILTLTGCDGATYVLQENDGSGYVDTAITSLPTTVDDANFYRLKVTCPCGVFYSNEVINQDCCVTDITIAAAGCTLYLDSTVNCSGSCIYIWQKSLDGGDTWIFVSSGSPTHIATDNALYRLYIPDAQPCQGYSNELSVECDSGGGCTGSLTVAASGCNLNVTNNPCATGNTWWFEKQSGSSWNVISSGSGSVPSSFTIGNNGSYRVRVACSNGCFYISNIVNFTTCDSVPPECESNLSLNVVECTLIASVTNCPNPVYTFRYGGSVIQSGSQNSMQIQADGVYTVEATNCPDCGVLSQSIQIQNCGNIPACNCTSTIFVNNCNNLLANENDCDGYTKIWQYSSNGSTGWQTVGGNNTQHTAAQNGYYRRLLMKSGCPNVTSNIIQVTCIPTCSPDLSIQVVNDCQIRVDWTGCAGIPTTTQWSRAANNPADDCSQCSGWIIGGGNVYNGVGPTSGYSIITPNYSDTCYRFILDCCGSGTVSEICIYWDGGGQLDVQLMPYSFKALSQPSVNDGTWYVQSMVVNGVDLVGYPPPHQITWSPDVSVQRPNGTESYNPSVVNALNAVSNNLIAFEIPTLAELNTCAQMSDIGVYIDMIKIITDPSVTSFDIKVSRFNEANPYGFQGARWTSNGDYYIRLFPATENDENWYLTPYGNYYDYDCDSWQESECD